AERFENGTHRATSDDARTGLGCTQQDATGAVATLDIMMQGAAGTERHEDQIALGGLGRLADRLRHFTRLAVAEANATLLVANNHQSGKAETATTLHNLGDTIDVDQLVDELAVALLAVPATV